MTNWIGAPSNLHHKLVHQIGISLEPRPTSWVAICWTNLQINDSIIIYYYTSLNYTSTLHPGKGIMSSWRFVRWSTHRRNAEFGTGGKLEILLGRLLWWAKCILEARNMKNGICTSIFNFLLPMCQTGKWMMNTATCFLNYLVTLVVRNTKAWPTCCFLLLSEHMKNGWANRTQTLCLSAGVETTLQLHIPIAVIPEIRTAWLLAVS